MADEINSRLKVLQYYQLGITEDYLKNIIAAENIAIVVDLQDQYILYATEAADSLFGYMPGEIQGMTLDKLIPEQYRESHKNHVEQYSKNPVRRPGEKAGKKLFGLKKDGTEFEVEIGLSARAKSGVRFAIARLTPKQEVHK